MFARAATCERSVPCLDSLAWHWLKGTTTKAEFGNPTQSTHYTLCVFDGAARLLMANEIGAGTGWRETRTGFSYRDTTLANDGIRRLLLREGKQRAKILVQGRGANLGMTNLEAGSGCR